MTQYSDYFITLNCFKAPIRMYNCTRSYFVHDLDDLFDGSISIFTIISIIITSFDFCFQFKRIRCFHFCLLFVLLNVYKYLIYVQAFVYSNSFQFWIVFHEMWLWIYGIDGPNRIRVTDWLTDFIIVLVVWKFCLILFRF